MRREISFTILEKPIAQQRHRHHLNKNYNPQYKEKIYYSQLIKNSPDVQETIQEHTLCGPLHVIISFFLPLPKTKWNRDKKGLYNINKPDLDNLIKFILDAMSGVIYADDAYIFKIEATKYNSAIPRTEVTVKEIIQEKI